MLMLMKEDEGKQGFVAAKCSVFIPVFIPVCRVFKFFDKSWVQ
jgi:hypothetical protein